MSDSNNQQPEKIPTQADIDRFRTRFNNAAVKLAKLENIIENFEKEHGPIEQVSVWVENIEQLRNNINLKHEECMNAVERAKSDFEKLIVQKRQEINSIVADESQTITTNVHEKTEDVFKSIQDKLDEFNDSLAICQNKLQKLSEQTDEDVSKIQTARIISIEGEKTISTLKADCVAQKDTVEQHLATISKILDDAQKALTSATSAGLAKEFEVQKKALKISQRNWVIVLMASLLTATIIAFVRFDSMLVLLASKDPVPDINLFINCLISITAIAAPVWLAWLATKQIGYNFRLSEDYAFKAATAASFEGFRKEIEALAQEDVTNNELRARLLATILDRLDEQPLRYIDKQTAGSPIHELLQKFPWLARKASPAQEDREKA